MNENDEVINDNLFSKLILRHFTNRNGRTGIWGMVHSNTFGPGAQVLAITRDRTVILERSYRIPMKAHVIELPGGSNDIEGESYIDVASRELREETGYTGGNYSFLGEVPESPGVTDQTQMLYVATDVDKTGPPTLGDDEEIEVIEIPLRELLTFLHKSKDLVDPKVFASIALLPPPILKEILSA